VKPVKNKRIRRKKPVPIPIPEPTPYTHYKCRFCGSMDNGMVEWSETQYGSASLVTLDGELDNYDSNSSDNFCIDNYRCAECDEDSNSQGILFVACTENGEVNPDEE